MAATGRLKPRVPEAVAAAVLMVIPVHWERMDKDMTVAKETGMSVVAVAAVRVRMVGLAMPSNMPVSGAMAFSATSRGCPAGTPAAVRFWRWPRCDFYFK